MLESIENRIKKLNSDLEYFKNVEGNDKKIKELEKTIYELGEQVEICEEVINELEPKIENVEKELKKTDFENKKKIQELEAKQELSNKEQKVYNDDGIKKSIKAQQTQLEQAIIEIKKVEKQKANNVHKHEIDDVEGLPAFLESIKEQTKNVSVGGYTKGVRSITSGLNIEVNNTDPRNPIVGAPALVPYTGAIANVDIGSFELIGAGAMAKTSAGLVLQNSAGTTIATVGGTSSDVLITGTGSTSGTYALQVQNSTGTNNGLVVRNDGHVGIGIAIPMAKLDVQGTRIRIGADFVTPTTRTDSTLKTGEFTVPHYLNAEEDVLAFRGISNSTDNTITFGGGTNNYNAANVVSFWTGATNTTVLGGERMRIDANGNIGVGTTIPTGKLEVKGSTANDGPTLGTEFLIGSGWTSTNWTGSRATGWAHNTGNTSVLSYPTAAVVSTRYYITYTVTNRTAGTFNISFGGQSINGISVTGGFGPTATTAGNFTVTPTSTFNGTIVISIKAITAVSTALINTLSSGSVQGPQARATTATLNTVYGFNSGAYLLNGIANTAMGHSSGANLTTSSNNTFFGYFAGSGTTTGGTNSAFGSQALFSNTIGTFNTSVGYQALFGNTTGSTNTAIGYAAGFSLTTGTSNTAIGNTALYSATTGTQIIAIGLNAGRFIADGTTANVTGTFGTYLGSSTKASVDALTNEVVIGYNAIGNGSNSVTLGSTAVTKTVLQGAVGIGTTMTTGVKLAIVGEGATSATNGLVVHNSTGTSNTLVVRNDGNIGIGTTAPSAKLDVAGSIVVTGATSVVRLKGYTVATLPTGTQGDTAYVTDALAPTFMGVLMGGGAVVTTCFYNGTAWVAQ